MTTDAGFLNDLGLENVSADPNHIADGKYPAHVFGSEIREKKAGGKSWVLTYKIDSSSPLHAGASQQEWFDLQPTGDNAELKRSFLKKRVLSLGVPESKIGSLNPNDLLGIACSVTIVHRNGYQNVGNVELVTDGATATVSAPTADTSSLM